MPGLDVNRLINKLGDVVQCSEIFRSLINYVDDIDCLLSTPVYTLHKCSI